MKNKNKVLKAGREIFQVQNNKELYKIASGFYAKLADTPAQTASGLGTMASNLVRKGMKKSYGIENLRMLTNNDGLSQLPYSNYIGPGTDLQHADQHGPVKQGPAAEKNQNGLSADEIAKIHDHAYHHASLQPKEQRFDLIQKADMNMLLEVALLPDSKTKSLIYKSIKAKYDLEKGLGKLVYGGGYFKRKKVVKGKGFVYTDPITTIENHIDNIISEKLTLPKKTLTGTLAKTIETQESFIKDQLEKIKKEKELETVALNEAMKPDDESKSSIVQAYNKSGNKAYYDYITDNSSRTKTMKYRLFFKKDKSISDSERPVVHYVETEEIIDYSTGDTYQYLFPINKDKKVDNLDFSFASTTGKPTTNPSVSIYSVINKLSSDKNSFTKPEQALLYKFGFILENSKYINFQIPDVKIERFVNKIKYTGYDETKAFPVKNTLSKQEKDDIDATYKEETRKETVKIEKHVFDDNIDRIDANYFSKVLEYIGADLRGKPQLKTIFDAEFYRIEKDSLFKIIFNLFKVDETNADFKKRLITNPVPWLKKLNTLNYYFHYSKVNSNIDKLYKKLKTIAKEKKKPFDEKAIETTQEITDYLKSINWSN